MEKSTRKWHRRTLYLLFHFLLFYFSTYLWAQNSIPFAEVAPILQTLREDLVPADLRGKSSSELAASWPEWVRQHDAVTRARIQEGDEDSLVYLLLYGTTFTQRPRASERDLAALVARPADALASLRPRIEGFVSSVASPGANERLQFARQLFVAKGMDPATGAGRNAAREYLDRRLQAAAAGGVLRSSVLLDKDAQLSDTLTLFRDRGLSSDTSIFIDHGIDQTINALKESGQLTPGSVRRVAIVGPGLDFTDKLEGYDFYPQQTIQPFAVIDSLRRYGLASEDLRVAAFDLSPRVLMHLEAARERARAGGAYTLVVPRNTDRPWSPALVNYWQRFGDRIGKETKAPVAPPGAGKVAARAVLVAPAVVQTVAEHDLNIVTDRIEPAAASDRFDLVIATNILLYYDVFEQALAAANVAKMLRPGGFLLTNNRIFELPDIPLGGVGYTDVTYMSLAGIGDTGDRIIWYQRR